MVVLGIDPGLSGALALYTSESRRLVQIEAMPVYLRKIGKAAKQRHVVDSVKLFDMMEGFDALGVDLVVLEQVASRPGDMGGVTAGYGMGLLVMACVALKLRLEVVQAAAWKRAMRVPADKKEAIQRALALFPEQRGMFVPPGGRVPHDGRAEAGMLAMYGGDHLKA